MIARLGSKLDTMLDGSNAKGSIAANEMTRYLDSGTFKLSLLEF